MLCHLAVPYSPYIWHKEKKYLRLFYLPSQGRRNRPDRPDLGLASIFQVRNVEATYYLVTISKALLKLKIWSEENPFRFPCQVFSKSSMKYFLSVPAVKKSTT